MAARLRVNPNRMELLKLKRRLEIAKRGHKLLKDKLDELMKLFLALVNEVSALREIVEKELSDVYQVFAIARSELSDSELDEALSFPKAQTEVRVERANLVSVAVPHFKLEIEGGYDCYGLGLTPVLLDISLQGFHDILPEMVELSQKEKSLNMLGEEIEKTRRRVNALEYVLIPNIEETVRYITMKLDEMERQNLTRLMKIKEMVS
ncbi:MAG: V-type ATP synthase subunit D [Actinomycetota bacterium]|nr:V-type ATP synthase subunit D [Actinomycetota bacterium]